MLMLHKNQRVLLLDRKLIRLEFIQRVSPSTQFDNIVEEFIGITFTLVADAVC